jgi:hypothetical protein
MEDMRFCQIYHLMMKRRTIPTTPLSWTGVHPESMTVSFFKGCRLKKCRSLSNLARSTVRERALRSAQIGRARYPPKNVLKATRLILSALIRAGGGVNEREKSTEEFRCVGGRTKRLRRSYVT